jgi:multimeric flavodoxin WrbA
MTQIYEKLIGADGIIFGSPTYWTMCGLGVNFLDRTTPLLYSAELANKAGGAIAVGAKIGVDHVLAIFRRFFAYMHMFCTDCVLGYAMGFGEITKDEFAMKASWELGREVVLFAEQRNKFPDEFQKYLIKIVYEKYNVARYPKP